MSRIICLFLLLLMVSCQAEQVNDSSHITEEDVVTALKEKDVDLIEAEFSQTDIFNTELNNVEPGTYMLSEKLFYIYEFETEQDREKGLKEFNEKTATAELVTFSTFVKRNILIFYVHEQDSNLENIPFEKEILEALNSIIEG